GSHPALCRVIRPMIHRLHQIAFLAGLAMATLIAAWSVATGKGIEDWIFWLIWPVMAVHQAEENVCTHWALGKRYRFLHWVRQVGFDISLSRHSLLNFGVGWTLAILAGLVGNTIVAFPLFVVATETANGLWHLGVSISRRDWSPGTLSSLVATFPLALTL